MLRITLYLFLLPAFNPQPLRLSRTTPISFILVLQPCECAAFAHPFVLLSYLSGDDRSSGPPAAISLGAWKGLDETRTTDHVIHFVLFHCQIFRCSSISCSRKTLEHFLFPTASACNVF